MNRHPAAAPHSGWPGRWRALLRSVHPVQGEAGRAQLLDALAQPPRPQVLGFVNAHAMNLAANDPGFYQALAAADTLLRDGQGMACLMRWLGQAPGLNLNGTDLIPRLLQRYAGQGIALFGTRDPWLSRAREQVLALAPGAHCVVADGFQPVAHYLSLASQARPLLVVLGMGMPRQEAVALALRESLQAPLHASAQVPSEMSSEMPSQLPWSGPCLIVCGGAILDFLGGRFQRAPRVLQRAGLEWAWRLACEPRRLFGRYVLGNPLFLARALQLAAAGRQAATPCSSARP